MRGKVNPGEPLINVVNENKPKVLRSPVRTCRLGPKGKGSGIGAPNSAIADDTPPAERRNLTHAGTCMERGKPVGLPMGQALLWGRPCGKVNRKANRWACG